jgi:hypothetical protein
MRRESKGHLSHCGRVISSTEELADIRETVVTCFRLSRSELALTIGEHLEGYSATGALKLDAYRPVVMETFVDPERYFGTCYRAANWLYLWDTTGTGLPRQGKSYTGSPRKIFVLPLVPDFRTALSSNGEPRP